MRWVLLAANARSSGLPACDWLQLSGL
jgi:hypothetical protein